jgi:hypothetical protein
MDVSNDAQQPVDLVRYITEQLPEDLLKFMAVRDELEQRQGALSAVEATIRLKAEAVDVLNAAKEEAEAILADAQYRSNEANELAAVTAVRRADLDAEESSFSVESQNTAKEQAAKDMALSARELLATEREAKLITVRDMLTAGQKALDARVMAFQDKVAAMKI